MIRIIVREQDANKAAHCGGQTETQHRTFDVELGDVERYLRKYLQDKGHNYITREVIGVELLECDEE